MSDNPAGSEELSIEEDAQEACKFIRSKTITPVSWFFPVTNACVSCVIVTGGRPEIMSAYCPRVIQLMSQQDLSEQSENDY